MLENQKEKVDAAKDEAARIFAKHPKVTTVSMVVHEDAEGIYEANFVRSE